MPDDRQPSTTRPQGLSTRTTGLIVAIGVLLIGAGLLGLIAVWSRPRPGDGPASLPKPPAYMPPTPVDLSREGLARAGRARVQFVDKADPTRVTGYLEWAALQPTSAGRADIDAPKALIFLRDGRALAISAARGRILYPAGRPESTESGAFDGGVLITLLPHPPTDDESPSAPAATPVAQLFTRAIDFNIPLGEVSIPGDFRASGPRFELSARGMRLTGDQVNTRLALAIDSTDYLYLAPDRPQPGDEPAPASPSAVASVPPQPPADAEAFYHAALADNVRVTRGGLTLDAHRLDAWARLVGGSLRLPVTPQSSDASPAEPAGAAPRPTAAKTPPEPRAPLARSPAIPGEPLVLFSLADPSGQVIVATWKGPLSVTPLDARPPQLQADELLADLASGPPPEGASDPDAGLVRGRDAASGGWVAAPRVRYAAAAQSIAVLGSGATPARLGMGTLGVLEVASAELDLRTGVGSARGPLALVAADDRPDRPHRVTCTDQADFALSARPGGGPGDKLRFVAFSGDVLAQDGSASLAAQSARLDFIGRQLAAGPLDGLIERLHAQGSVRAAESDGGSLACDTLDVAFEPSPTGKAADPTDVQATGSVVARRAGWVLSADTVSAALTRDERNRIVVASATAEGVAEPATVSGRGVRAAAKTLRADVPSRTLDLLGPRVTLARDGGTITGTQMRLDGAREELTVFGAGALDYQPEGAADPAAVRSASAAWTRAFTFSNLDGRAECVGDVRAAVERSPLEADELTAQRVELRFTPGTPGSGFEALADGQAEPARAPLPAATAEPRRLLRAEAIGSDDLTSGQLARVESRRFASPLPAALPGQAAGVSPQRAVERLVLAEGARIIADEATPGSAALRIPGAGRALLDDRRLPAPAPTPGASAQPATQGLPSELGNARGTTLLAWGRGPAPADPAGATDNADAHGLVFTRADGLLALSGGARIIHRQGPDQPVLTIDARRCEARLNTGDRDSPPAGSTTADGRPRQAVLASATALGDVAARSEAGANLTADRLHFDAATSQAEASADPPARVVFAEPGSATPVIARVLRWDIARQRATIVEPAPTIAPR